jgi:hypothetical protein
MTQRKEEGHVNVKCINGPSSLSEMNNSHLKLTTHNFLEPSPFNLILDLESAARTRNDTPH